MHQERPSPSPAAPTGAGVTAARASSSRERQSAPTDTALASWPDRVSCALAWTRARPQRAPRGDAKAMHRLLPSRGDTAQRAGAVCRVRSLFPALPVRARRLPRLFPVHLSPRGALDSIQRRMPRGRPLQGSGTTRIIRFLPPPPPRRLPPPASQHKQPAAFAPQRCNAPRWGAAAAAVIDVRGREVSVSLAPSRLAPPAFA